MKNRRKILTSAGALLTSSAFAQTDNQPGTNNKSGPLPSVKPFLEIGKFAEDKDRLFMFVSYTCPFCANLHAPLVNWAQSIPPPMKLITIPVGDDSEVANESIFAHYIVRDLMPNQLEAFSQEAYRVGQSNPQNSSYLKILNKMGIKKDAILASLKGDTTKQRVIRGQQLAQRYRVQVTPTFGVAGRWSTNPGFTSGKTPDLVALLNVLVTTAIQGGELTV